MVCGGVRWWWFVRKNVECRERQVCLLYHSRASDAEFAVAVSLPAEKSSRKLCSPLLQADGSRKMLPVKILSSSAETSRIQMRAPAPNVILSKRPSLPQHLFLPKNYIRAIDVRSEGIEEIFSLVESKFARMKGICTPIV